MGLLNKMAGKLALVSESGSPPTGEAPGPDGRERLRHADAELKKARDSVADLEGRVIRMTTIISDAGVAQSALQEAIAADGGLALAAYGAGNASDAPIAKLVEKKENTTRAASAAKDALPGVRDALAKARDALAKAETAKFDATIVYLKKQADAEHDTYVRNFNSLCASYDKMCAIAVALSATDHGDMMTTGLPVPIKAPGFNMGIGPSHGPSEMVIMQHTTGNGEARVAEWTAKWLKARERLAEDADADLDDLIGMQFQYESDRDL